MYREVHVSRLRPFTIRLPLDSAEEALYKSPSEELNEELANLKDATVLQKTPTKQKTAFGKSPEWSKKWDPLFVDEDITDPEFVVEKILKFKEVDGKFLYFTKWLGFSHRSNTWQDESDMHPDLIAEYWESIKDKFPTAYRKHSKRLSTSLPLLNPMLCYPHYNHLPTLRRFFRLLLWIPPSGLQTVHHNLPTDADVPRDSQELRSSSLSKKGTL
jgi:hypothetical protein